MQKKSFLIVTASIGSGHVKAAEAISGEIKIKYPDAHIHIVDFMSTETAYLNGFLKEAYLKMLDFMPNVYDFLYNFTAGRAQGISVQSIIAIAMKRNMDEIIRTYEPDIVICTHPFPCAAAAYLKKSHQLHILLACVITDYSVHQLWVYKNVNLYFVANDKLRDGLEARGVKAERIYVTGIPIEESFNKVYDKKVLLSRFNLQEALPIVLIMGGGLGLGGVNFALEQLEKISIPMQILVVTGKNTSLWSKIREYARNSQHKIDVWGYSNNVQEFMAIATCLVSKPGALTISEALAMELPMLLHEPIPGPETDNAAYVSGVGAAIWIKENEKLGEAVADVLCHPELLAEMQKQAHIYKKPYAARDIVSYIHIVVEKMTAFRISL